MSETPLNKDCTKLIKDFYLQSSPMSLHEIQTPKLLIIHLIFFFFFFNQMAVSCNFTQMNKGRKKDSTSVKGMRCYPL